ncbi:unnamed protein product, partial [Heterosigma akashiwo]
MKWLDSIVIKQKLCPFAPPVRNAPQLRIKVSDAESHDDIIKDIEKEAHLLVSESDPYAALSERPETTLVVLNTNKCESLADFRNMVSLSWRVQEEVINEHSYTLSLQLVLFHPKAKHQTYAEGFEEDAADYTIRSPFPIIHLLREADVMKAVTSGYNDLENLPSRNKNRLRKDGLQVCAQRLENCKKLQE